jgi:hypothetical protein
LPKQGQLSDEEDYDEDYRSITIQKRPPARAAGDASEEEEDLDSGASIPARKSPTKPFSLSGSADDENFPAPRKAAPAIRSAQSPLRHEEEDEEEEEEEEELGSAPRLARAPLQMPGLGATQEKVEAFLDRKCAESEVWSGAVREVAIRFES